MKSPVDESGNLLARKKSNDRVQPVVPSLDANSLRVEQARSEATSGSNTPRSQGTHTPKSQHSAMEYHPFDMDDDPNELRSQRRASVVDLNEGSALASSSVDVAPADEQDRNERPQQQGNGRERIDSAPGKLVPWAAPRKREVEDSGAARFLGSTTPQFLRDEGRDVPLRDFFTIITMSRITKELRNPRGKGALKGSNCSFNLEENSVFLLEPENSFRRRLFFFVDSDSFDRFILLCIVLNCIALILGTPGLQEMSGVQTMVDVAEIVFQTIFTIEMIVKILALGFVLHEHSYLRSVWNRIDFAIVVLGFVSFFVSSNFSAVRLVRVLRPLRAVSKVPELAALVRALLSALPRMRDALFLLFFVLLIFSILGLQLFVGQFSQRCYVHQNTSFYEVFPQFGPSNNSSLNWTAINPRWEVVPVLIPFDSSVCSTSSSYGHQCPANSSCEVHKDIYNPIKDFDNIASAMLSVLKIMTLDINWPQTVRAMQATSGVMYFAYAFVVLTIGAYCTLRLILAILKSEYKSARENITVVVVDSIDDLAESDSDDERKKKTTQGKLQKRSSMNALLLANPNPGKIVAAKLVGNKIYAARRPQKKAKRPKDQWTFHEVIFNFVQTDIFSGFMMFVTIVNVIALGIDFHNIPLGLETALNWVNFSCSLLFILEMLLKVYGLGIAYFYDGFNRFDFILVMISIPEMVISGAGSGSAFSVLRAFRLARVLRVLKASNNVRLLVLTVIKAAAGAAYIFLLLLLFVLVMSLVGVNLFQNAYPMNYRPHFRNLGDAAIAVFIVMTGSGWVEMGEIAMDNTKWYAIFYFIMVFCIGSYIVLNFFVALLIDEFASAEIPEDEDELLHKQFLLMQMKAKLQQERRASLTQDPVIQLSKRKSTSAVLHKRTSLLLKAREATPTNAATAAAPSSKDAESAGKYVEETPAILNSPSSTGLLSPGHKSFENDSFADNDVIPAEDAGILGLAFRQSRTHSQLGLSTFERIRKASKDDDNDDASSSSSNEGGVSHELDAPSASVSGAIEKEASGLWEPPQLKRKLSIRISFRKVTEKHSDKKLRAMLKGNSLFYFGPDSAFRMSCGRLLYHPAFDWFIVFMIFASCVMLFLDYPDAKSNNGLQTALWWTDLFFAVVFALEAALHAVVEGMILGDKAYLSDGWNRLDFIVVIASIVGIFVPVVAMFRSLRSFKIAAKSDSLRIIISSMFSALPAVTNTAMLVLFVFIIFGILGVQLFKGAFVYCTDPSVDLRTECVGLFNRSIPEYELSQSGIKTTYNSVPTERHWKFTFTNFNNLGNALLFLFIVAVNGGYKFLLFQAIDSRDYDHALQQYARPYMSIYVLSFVIVGTFFMMSLFIGSLINSFTRERDKKEGKIGDEGEPLLTDKQVQWIRAYQVTRLLTLPRRPPTPEIALRRWCCNLYFADERRLDVRPSFEWSVTGLIIVNALVMCLQYDGMPKSFEDALFWTNLGFAILYTIEAAIKLIALLPPGYFMDGWNRFDFALVVLAYASMFGGGPAANSLRVLRVGRVLRLIKRAEGLQRLFNALLYSVPQLLNVTLLLVLCLFIFGVVGTEMFGQVMQQPEHADSALHEYFNFHHAGYSIMLLFQVATMKSWWEVMRSCMIKPDNSPCTYEKENCGTSWAILYFVCFMVAVHAVLLNFFVFVIISNYGEVRQLSVGKAGKSISVVEQLREDWIKEDADLTGVIHWKKFVELLRKMPFHFGFGPTASDIRLLGRLRVMDIPLNCDLCVTYKNCVEGLTRETFGLDRNSANAAARVLKGPEQEDLDRYFKIAHAFSVFLIRQTFDNFHKRLREVTQRNSFHAYVKHASSCKEMSGNVAIEAGQPPTPPLDLSYGEQRCSIKPEDPVLPGGIPPEKT